MVSVLGIRPKVRSAEGDGFLREIKIRCTPSYEEDAKPLTTM
jgi:hypothetical protein